MTSKEQRLDTRLKSVFGLKSIPFSKDLDSSEFFQTEVFQRGFDRLRYLTDRRGIGAVFGAPGTGKSTLLRALIDSLGRTSHVVCYVTHTTCAAVDLYREIARGFQIEARYRKVDVLKDLKERVLKISESQRLKPVLILDEAHLLARDLLDELRILTSYEQDGRDHLTLILAGHPQLESNLRLAVNEAFAQRIIARVRLRSLREDEVAEYLDFRLRHAGRTAKLFLPEALKAVATGSRGIPRLIDRLGEQSLLIALQKGAKEIDVETVMEAVDEVDP